MSYAREVMMIADSFMYELCGECGKDIDLHVISPDPLGHAHLFCMRGVES